MLDETKASKRNKGPTNKSLSCTQSHTNRSSSPSISRLAHKSARNYESFLTKNTLTELTNHTKLTRTVHRPGTWEGGVAPWEPRRPASGPR